jgi:uncharacterized protein YukE
MNTLARLWFTSIIWPQDMAADPLLKQFNSLNQTVKRLKEQKAKVIDALETAEGEAAKAWSKELKALNQELAATQPKLEELKRQMNQRN